MKLNKIIFATAITVLMFKAIGYIQTDHLECKVTEVNGNLITFQAYGDNEYVWEEETGRKFKVGESYKVNFFDFEDFDEKNNIITSVEGRCE